MNITLQQHVQATKQDTNLGLVLQTRRRNLFTQWIIVGLIAVFFLGNGLTVRGQPPVPPDSPSFPMVLPITQQEPPVGAVIQHIPGPHSPYLFNMWITNISSEETFLFGSMYRQDGTPLFENVDLLQGEQLEPGQTKRFSKDHLEIFCLPLGMLCEWNLAWMEIVTQKKGMVKVQAILRNAQVPNAPLIDATLEVQDCDSYIFSILDISPPSSDLSNIYILNQNHSISTEIWGTLFIGESSVGPISLGTIQPRHILRLGTNELQDIFGTWNVQAWLQITTEHPVIRVQHWVRYQNSVVGLHNNSWAATYGNNQANDFLTSLLFADEDNPKYTFDELGIHEVAFSAGASSNSNATKQVCNANNGVVIPITSYDDRFLMNITNVGSLKTSVWAIFSHDGTYVNIVSKLESRKTVSFSGSDLAGLCNCTPSGFIKIFTTIPGTIKVQAQRLFIAETFLNINPEVQDCNSNTFSILGIAHPSSSLFSSSIRIQNTNLEKSINIWGTLFFNEGSVGPIELATLSPLEAYRLTNEDLAQIATWTTGRAWLRIEADNEGLMVRHWERNQNTPANLYNRSSAAQECPLQYDFGKVTINNSATQSFIIFNRDNNPLPMGTIEVIDEFGSRTTSSSTEFIISNDQCSGEELSAAEECQFLTEFHPQSVGEKTATVYIHYYSDEFGNPSTPLTVPLKGNGIKADLGLEISVEPMSHDFGEIFVDFSEYQLFKVSNQGTVKFKIGKITIPEISMSAMGSGFFIEGDSCSGQTLQPPPNPSSCFVVVRFTPPVVGGRTATLYIPYGPETSVSVSLKGTGVDWCPDPPLVKINPDPMDFGNVPVGSTMSLPVHIYMQANNCKLPLKIDDITVIGPDAGEFAILKPLWCKSGSYGNTSYSYCQSKLVFNAAKSAGTKDAKLEIVFNDSTTQIVPINVKVIVEPPDPKFEVEPTAHDFGNVVIGKKSEPYEFTVKNTGNVTLWPSTFSMSGGDENDFKVVDGSCLEVESLPQPGSCTISVIFKPQQPPGIKNTELFISFKSSSSPPEMIVAEVPLTGMAIEPEACSEESITIETIKSGNWNDPSVWQKLPLGSAIAIPGPNDIVRIKNGHVVTAPSGIIKVKALCIEGGGTLESKLSTISLKVDAKERIKNEGTIRAQDDDGGIECVGGCSGADILLYVGKVCYLPWAVDDKPVSSMRNNSNKAANFNLAIPYYWCYYEGDFYNKGKIIAGDGTLGHPHFGGRGGNIKIKAGNISIYGNLLHPLLCKNDNRAICAGSGSAGQPGGGGGNILIEARNKPYNQSLVYMCRPHIEAGNGGGGSDGYPARDGGDLVIRGYTKKIECKPVTLKAGKGGISDGTNGEKGDIRIDPKLLSISGDETTISGGNVTLFGGEDATIELNGLNDGAITATGDLTLAVGEGGVIRSNSTNNFLQADGQVNLFADHIVLDQDVNVSDITGDNVVVGRSRILRDVSLTASGNFSGNPGVTLPLDLSLSNNNPEADTYLITVTNEQDWSLSQLPSSVEIASYGTVELPLDVVLPPTGEATNVITVTAISQTNPTVVTTTEISLVVQPDSVTSTPSSGVSTCPSSGVIRGVCSNRGQLISDAFIEEGASIAGGTITATVNNNGLISHVTIGVDAVVNGGKVTGTVNNNGTLANIEFVGRSVTGGELLGNITNTSEVGGVFINVRLAANTIIDGGAVQGEISGDPQEPALLKNLQVRTGSRLTNVIIGENVKLADEVELVEGVRFSHSGQIPSGELIGLLPALLAGDLDGIDYPIRADFSADLLVPSDGLLSAINKLPDLKDNAWVIRQNAELSHFELTIDQLRFALLPVSVTKATTAAGLIVQDAQTVRFVTESGLEVLAHPALQAPSALQSALSQFGLTEFTVQTNGNLFIPSTAGQWFSARPDWTSVELVSETESGLQFGQSPLVTGPFLTELVFSDEEGRLRQQTIYPSIAQPSVLYSSAQAVKIEPFGLISFKQDGKAYRGVVDYVVSQNEAIANTLQVESIPDANGDGIPDVMLVYPNGEQQKMFIIE